MRLPSSSCGCQQRVSVNIRCSMKQCPYPLSFEWEPITNGQRFLCCGLLVGEHAFGGELVITQSALSHRHRHCGSTSRAFLATLCWLSNGRSPLLLFGYLLFLVICGGISECEVEVATVRQTPSNKLEPPSNQAQKTQETHLNRVERRARRPLFSSVAIKFESRAWFCGYKRVFQGLATHK